MSAEASLSDPIGRFESWYEEACARSASPETVALATADPRGNPSVRMVYFKGIREEGFSFFTNYESRKGRELARNPRAAMTFYWPELRRQVRIEGACRRLSPEASRAYFATRARESQLSAHASRQSEVMPSDGALEARILELEEHFGDQPIPCPENWGGYALIPEKIEFWSGRPFRRHERRLFEKTAEGWVSRTLYP